MSLRLRRAIHHNEGGSASGEGGGEGAGSGSGNEGGAAGNGAGGRSGYDEGTVREIKELRAERRDLRKQLTSRDAELEALRGSLSEKATAAEALAGQVKEWEAKFASAEEGWKEQEALMGAGLTDPKAIAVARTLHGFEPEDKRGTLVEWVQGFKAEGAEVPPGLAPYLGQQQAGGGQPKPAAGRKQPPPANGEPSEEARRAAREYGQKTGDWSRFTALLPEESRALLVPRGAGSA